MKRICLHIQSLTQVDKDVLISGLKWAFWVGRHTDHEIMLSTPNRGSIDRGRNEAAKIALATECDYLWFLDDDMPILPHTLQSLIDCNADIAMAHSYIRGYPFQPMCFKWTPGSGPSKPQDSSIKLYADDEELEKDIDPVSGLVDVAALGFTCALIDIHLLKELQPPYFVTSPNQTEDVHFCLRAQFEIDRPLKFVVDTKVPTTHLGNKEYINSLTVKELKKFYEAVEHIKSEENLRGDRSRKYLEEVDAL